MVLTVLLNNGAVRSCCKIRRQGPGLETRKEESGLFHNCPWVLLHLWKMGVQLQVSLPIGSWATTSGGQSLKARSHPRSPPGPGGCRSPVLLPGSLKSAGKPCDFHREGEEGRGQGQSREGKEPMFPGAYCAPGTSHWALVTRSPWQTGQPPAPR